MKYQFLGNKDKVYNFPALRLFNVTVENFTDAIGDILFKAGKTDLVKLAKAEKKEA